MPVIPPMPACASALVAAVTAIMEEAVRMDITPRREAISMGNTETMGLHVTAIQDTAGCIKTDTMTIIPGSTSHTETISIMCLDIMTGMTPRIGIPDAGTDIITSFVKSPEFKIAGR